MALSPAPDTKRYVMKKFSLPKSPQQLRIMALLAILLAACSLILWHALNQYRTTEQEKYTS